MKRALTLATLSVAIIASSPLIAAPAKEKPFTVTVEGVKSHKPIPEKHAFCVATKTEKSAQSGKNISPRIRWTKGPEGTLSYALVMVDPDVPTDFTNAGKEGTTIAHDMPRQDFYHWTIINIPPTVTEIKEGQGKTFGIMGVNDYLKFQGLENTMDNQIKFRGYDGPCPPWNDERVHTYHFKVFALSTDKIVLKAPFTGKQAMDEINKYAIATADIVGTYTLNPALKKSKKSQVKKKAQ